MDKSPDAQQPQGSPGRPSTATGRVGGSKDDEAVAVRVAVHIRPLVEIELARGCQEILDVTPNTPQISVGSHRFTYDNVYGSGGADDAHNLYPHCVQPLVDGLFRGYNATVFAYGQTGSGKTYTMGSAWSPEEDNRGVIPNVMDELFSRVEHDSHTDFTIKVSFVEIHKEEVRDLLWANSAGPRPVVTIRELPSGVSLAGACERNVTSREEMSNVLMQGTLMRAVAATNMNNRSSRSHAIFTITLEQRRRQLLRPASAPPAVDSTPRRGLQDGDTSSSSEGDDSAEDEEEEEAGDEYLIAKMHLVDLAGSERAKRTGAEGARLKEAININKGLLALAKVITALVDGQSHVPYRDSKLTRLLQDSLGGNSRTVMIACVSPADINREETLNTLRYADRARRIKNKPVVNRDPMAAQLAALRQQIAGLRAENLALRTALGGDKEAAAVIAAAGRGAHGVASAALQEAYDDLALRFNGLELEHTKQEMQLESYREEISLLRSGLLTAETQRDQLQLRLQALQAAASACDDPGLQEALAQDTRAAAAGAAGAAEPAEAAAGDSNSELTPAAVAAADAGVDEPVSGLQADMGVVQTLRARVVELEAELRQARSLQRMASSVFARGISSALGSRSPSVRRTSSRPASSAGQLTGAAAAAAPGRRAGARLAAHPLEHISDTGNGLDEGVYEGQEGPHGDGDLSPMTPARPSGIFGGDDLGEPLPEVPPDADILDKTASHILARDELALKLEVLSRQMEAKQKRLLALQCAADIEGAKTKFMQELQKERDSLAKEKAALEQKISALKADMSEEKKRLEQTYKDKLTTIERRLKDLKEREKATQRTAAELPRVQRVCQQLQADIAKMKAARAQLQRRMEAKEKEFREWRLTREREVIQLRRNAQRQNAALQQHQAMHSKQQAVLKRKTEEAEAARRKLRELTELQARVRRDKAALQGAAGAEAGGSGADLELQPSASAPLLRNTKARRVWIEQEMELCSTSWQYQKVLEGELEQRADASRKLREVQKQLMLLGGLVPPSPVVTAAAAAAARGRRGSSSSMPGSLTGGLSEEAALTQEAQRLQESIDSHTRSVKELQEQCERARAEEQSRGAGAADVKRWTGIRNIVEAREMLRTLFVSACTQRAQVYEAQMELAKVQEKTDILEIRLDMALQQAEEARRKALSVEATAAAVITTPGLAAAAVAAAGDGSDGEGQEAAAAAAGTEHITPGRRQQGQLPRLLQQQLLRSSAAAVLDDPAEHRDENDREADSLIQCLGLPPIQEMPSPLADERSSGAASSSGNGAAAAAAAAQSQRLAAWQGRYWRGSGSSRTGALLRQSTEGWASQDAGPSVGPSADGGAGGKGSSSGSATASRRGSATAQHLAAKLDALQGEWQGYKRSAAAAAAGGGAGSSRRSLSAGGGQPGSRRSSSVPCSPRVTSSGVGAAGQQEGVSPFATPVGGQQRRRQQQQQQQVQQSSRRVSQSANSSPVGDRGNAAVGWGTQQQHGDAARGGAGAAAAAGMQPGEQEQQQQGLLLRTMGSLLKLGRGAVAAISGGGARPEPEPEVDGVVKSLDFQEDEGEAAASGSRAQQQQQQQRASGRSSGVQILQLDAAPGASSSSAAAARDAANAEGTSDDDEELLLGDDFEGETESEEEEEEAEGESDNEEQDPSYDPTHATPAAAPRRSTRQSGRSNRARAGRTSGASSGDPSDSLSGGAESSRASSRSRSFSQQQQQQQAAAGGGSAQAAAAAAALARQLAAQVSFNHEKRQGWERPVLEDINTRRAAQGLPPVDKLTIQLLKENLVGQELDGKPWAPGSKTKDILIADYRRVLQLSSHDEELTSINRITGAANWPMPGQHPASVPSSPQGTGSWAAAARRGAGAEAAAEGAFSSRPSSGTAGPRRVLSTSLPPSPSGRDPYRAAFAGSSPLRASQQLSRAERAAAAGTGSNSQQGRGSPPQHSSRIWGTSGGGSSSSRPVSSPGSSPPHQHHPGGNPRLLSPAGSPYSPRPSHREQQGGYGGYGGQGGSAAASPRAGPGGVGATGSSRGAIRAGRMASLVGQSLDSSLLQAGAAREQQAQLGGALQQAPQRTLRSSSNSSASAAPGSATKLRVVIPQSRPDGPFSSRTQQQGSSASTGLASDRGRGSSGGQPTWR